MPYGKLETLQDCQDFIEGCLFMGTGGGGDVEWGMGMLREALADAVHQDFGGRSRHETFLAEILPSAEGLKHARRRLRRRFPR